MKILTSALLLVALSGCNSTPTPTPGDHSDEIAEITEGLPYNFQEKGIYVPSGGRYRIAHKGSYHVLIILGWKKIHEKFFPSSDVWREFKLSPTPRASTGFFKLEDFNAKHMEMDMPYGTLKLFSENLEPIETLRLGPDVALHVSKYVYPDNP